VTSNKSFKPQPSYNSFTAFQGQSFVSRPSTRKPHFPHLSNEQYQFAESSPAQPTNSDQNQDNPEKCPLINPFHPSECIDAKDNCWSAGVPDLDCPNSGLCCFDGCANTCVDSPLEKDEIADAFEDIETLSESLSDPIVENEESSPNLVKDSFDTIVSDDLEKCPSIPPYPEVSCIGARDNCWSAGVPDLDCPNSGLCCFDGCANRCINGPEEEQQQANSESYPSEPYINPIEHQHDEPDEQFDESAPEFVEPDAANTDPNKCPTLDPFPASSCIGKEANCWSAGVPDLDCPNSGLCCFDGCVNTCVDEPDYSADDSFPVSSPDIDGFSNAPSSNFIDQNQQPEFSVDHNEETSASAVNTNPYECPLMASKPLRSCVGKKANCWSAGVLDLDCPNYGLCCFDGCVNSCVDEVNKTYSQSVPTKNDELHAQITPDLAEDAPDYSDFTATDDIVDENFVIPNPISDDPEKCPFITPLPALSCANRVASCWSAGVPDLDCPDYSLCCYDGCVNSCLNKNNYNDDENSDNTAPANLEEINVDPAQVPLFESDTAKDNLEQEDQSYLDTPQETLSYSDNPDICPVIPPKPANSCLHKKANCWSAGVPDLDCPNFGLCCYDGCVNRCIATNDEFDSVTSPDSIAEDPQTASPVADSVTPDENFDAPMEVYEEDFEEPLSTFDPHTDSYGSPTADPVKLVTSDSSLSSSTETLSKNISSKKQPTVGDDTSEESLAGPFQDPPTNSDNSAHGASSDTINNPQITDITVNGPSNAQNSDEFVFPISSSKDPIQNTIMILLDTYGPPKTSPTKPLVFNPVKPSNAPYIPQIDSYGSPTADPVKISTSQSSHYSTTENSEDSNDIIHFTPVQYNPVKQGNAGSKFPNRQNIGPVEPAITPVKTSYIKPPVRPVKQTKPVNQFQQTDYAGFTTGPGNYGSKLTLTKTEAASSFKPTKIVNYDSIDTYGSPLADPISNVKKLHNTRKPSYLKPVKSGLRPLTKLNSKFSPVFHESVRLTTPRANIYRPKDKYYKKILKKKYVKGIKKQPSKIPSEPKSSLGKFWEKHFNFFPILEQPTTKPSFVRSSSCPEVQPRSPESCKLNFQNFCTKVGKRDHLCPYDDICCFDGCANRCLNWKPPQNVFFRESVGVFVQ